MTNQLRYKLILGKFAVSRVIEKRGLLEFSVDIQGVKLVLTGPKADVREGDLLTLYTEVLAHAPQRQTENPTN